MYHCPVAHIHADAGIPEFDQRDHDTIPSSVHYRMPEYGGNQTAI